MNLYEHLLFIYKLQLCVHKSRFFTDCREFFQVEIPWWYFPFLIVSFNSFSVFGEGVKECLMTLVSGKLLSFKNTFLTFLV